MYCNRLNTVEAKPWKWNAINPKPDQLDKFSFEEMSFP